MKKRANKLTGLIMAIVMTIAIFTIPALAQDADSQPPSDIIETQNNGEQLEISSEVTEISIEYYGAVQEASVVTSMETNFMGLTVQELVYTPYVEITDANSYLDAMDDFYYVEESFSNASEEFMYGVYMDFSDTDKIIVDVNVTGLGRVSYKVYDSDETLLKSYTSTDKTNTLYGSWTPNSGGIVFDSSNYESGYYYILISPYKLYDNTNFRLLVGDERNYDYYRMGKENAQTAPRYLDTNVMGNNTSYNGRGAFAYSYPTPRLTEEYYKFTVNGLTSFYFASYSTQLHFRIEDENGTIIATSETFNNARRTSYTLGGSFQREYKISYRDLSLVNGRTYYLAVYNTASAYGQYAARPSNTRYNLYIGEPHYTAASSALSTVTFPSVSSSGTNYSSYVSVSIAAQNIPQTAIVREITLGDKASTTYYSMREIYNTSNNLVFSTTHPKSSIAIKATPSFGSSQNTPVNGTWRFRFKATKSLSITPTVSIKYWYETGD